MRELVTTLLDTLGLLLLAAGLSALVFPLLGWACLAVAGIVVLLGSGVAAWRNRPTVAVKS
jgi:hypothetical protein